MKKKAMKKEDMIVHNEMMIADEVLKMLKERTDKAKISAYERREEKRMREFKNFLKEGGEPVFDTTTHMYIIPTQSTQKD